MNLFFKDREAYLKNELKKLELEYLKLIKIQQKRDCIKEKIIKCLNNCVNILKSYASQETHSPEVRVSRKDFVNDYRDLLQLLNEINECAEERHSVSKTNDYICGKVSERFIDMSLSSTGPIINLVNIRHLDDRLMELYELSIQLRKEVMKYGSNNKKIDDLEDSIKDKSQATCDEDCVAVTKSLTDQICLLERIMIETVKLNMVFSSHNFSQLTAEFYYDSMLHEILNKLSNNCDIKEAVAKLDGRLYDLESELYVERNKYMQNLKTVCSEKKAEYYKKKEMLQSFEGMISSFEKDFSSKIGTSLTLLTVKLESLNRVANNTSLKRFLEECRLQMPLLISFLESFKDR